MRVVLLLERAGAKESLLFPTFATGALRRESQMHLIPPTIGLQRIETADALTNSVESRADTG